MDVECCDLENFDFPAREVDPPERTLDWVVLAFVLVAVVPFVVANVVLFLHRNRRLFQVSGWDLLLGSSVFGLIWIASALVVNEHFRRDKVEFLSYCALWTFWLELTLGICGWLTMVALRLYFTKIVVSSKQKPNPALIWLFYFPLVMAPAIIFSIVATVERVSLHPCDNFRLKCVIRSKAWKLSLFLVLPPVYFSFIIIILVRVRKQTDYLLKTQYQQAKESAMMAFVLYLLTGTTYWTKRQNDVTGRCFLTFCVCSLVFIRFWVHTGWPVYLCLFRRGDAMEKYEEFLRKQGAACLQETQGLPCSDIPNDGDYMSQSLTFDGNEAIVEAVAIAQAENQDLKITRESLHRRINQIRIKLEELKRPNVPYSQSFVTPRDVEKVLPNPTQSYTRHLSLETRSNSRI